MVHEAWRMKRRDAVENALLSKRGRAPSSASRVSSATSAVPSPSAPATPPGSPASLTSLPLPPHYDRAACDSGQLRRFPVDGGYASLCPELNIASQGSSIEEARANLVEALTLF